MLTLLCKLLWLKPIWTKRTLSLLYMKTPLSGYLRRGVEKNHVNFWRKILMSSFLITSVRMSVMFAESLDFGVTKEGHYSLICSVFLIMCWCFNMTGWPSYGCRRTVCKISGDMKTLDEIWQKRGKSLKIGRNNLKTFIIASEIQDTD